MFRLDLFGRAYVIKDSTRIGVTPGSVPPGALAVIDPASLQFTLYGGFNGNPWCTALTPTQDTLLVSVMHDPPGRSICASIRRRPNAFVLLGSYLDLVDELRARCPNARVEEGERDRELPYRIVRVDGRGDVSTRRAPRTPHAR